MQTTVRRAGSVAVVTPRGVIHRETGNSLERAVDLALRSDVETVVISFRYVAQLPSDGIRLLVALRDRVEQAKRAFHIADLAKNVHYTLKITNLLAFLHYTPSLRDVLESAKVGTGKVEALREEQAAEQKSHAEGKTPSTPPPAAPAEPAPAPHAASSPKNEAGTGAPAKRRKSVTDVLRGTPPSGSAPVAETSPEAAGTTPAEVAETAGQGTAARESEAETKPSSAHDPAATPHGSATKDTDAGAPGVSGTSENDAGSDVPAAKPSADAPADKADQATEAVKARIRAEGTDHADLSDHDIRKLISRHLPNREAVEIVSYFFKRHVSVADVDALAKGTGLKPKEVKRIAKELVIRGVLKSMGANMFNYGPEDELNEKIRRFLDLWHERMHRRRLLGLFIEAG